MKTMRIDSQRFELIDAKVKELNKKVKVLNKALTEVRHYANDLNVLVTSAKALSTQQQSRYTIYGKIDEIEELCPECGGGLTNIYPGTYHPTAPPCISVRCKKCGWRGHVTIYPESGEENEMVPNKIIEEAITEVLRGAEKEKKESA